MSNESDEMAGLARSWAIAVDTRRESLAEAIANRDRAICAYAERTGLTPGKIARRMGMSTTNVRMILDRGKRRAQ